MQANASHRRQHTSFRTSLSHGTPNKHLCIRTYIHLTSTYLNSDDMPPALITNQYSVCNHHIDLMRRAGRHSRRSCITYDADIALVAFSPSHTECRETRESETPRATYTIHIRKRSHARDRRPMPAAACVSGRLNSSIFRFIVYICWWGAYASLVLWCYVR